MCQEQYNTNKREFKQLTYKERIKIETLYNDQHLNYTEIGNILGKHRTTISRDIKLGLVLSLLHRHCAYIKQLIIQDLDPALLLLLLETVLRCLSL